MILILSDTFDSSTNDVIDYLGYNYVRMNEDDFLHTIHYEMGNPMLQIGFKRVDMIHIMACWYRRGDLNLGVELSGEPSHLKTIEYNCDNEWKKLRQFLLVLFENKRTLGSFEKETNHNKLITLYHAQRVGLAIPKTLITNLKSSIFEFQQAHPFMITKAMNNMFCHSTQGMGQTIGVQPVEQSNIAILNHRFFPTLFQEKVEKKFELRIFYIKNHFFAMAIFSQNDEKTKIDYRNYNRQKPNRNIPYTLPPDIVAKLQHLMNQLELDSGSIDMIVTNTNEYVFLEVNPTGQFGWVSEHCNYYLEQKIAYYLQHGAIIYE